MFEEYQFAGVYIAIQAVLTLYAQGESYLQCGTPPSYGTLIPLPMAVGATKGRENRPPPGGRLWLSHSCEAKAFTRLYTHCVIA